MAGPSKIEWCTDTWNPIVGCSLASPGCTNCYAMAMAARIERMNEPRVLAGDGRQTHYAGTTRQANGRSVWTGKLALAPEAILLQPLRWARPRRIFVNSMGDLFHDDVPDAWIDQVFAVMALCPQHTFQVLTKRSARMRAYFEDQDLNNRISAALGNMLDGGWIWNEGKRFRNHIEHIIDVFLGESTDDDGDITYHDDPMPLPNVWLGVSAEDQRRADERVPDLLATPAAVRFVSAEPLLGPIDFTDLDNTGDCRRERRHGISALCLTSLRPRLDWIIVGGESGPNARPMQIGWARSIVAQCKAADVRCFVKQLGTEPVWDDEAFLNLRDRKGGDLSEWPEDLRVREMPGAAA